MSWAIYFKNGGVGTFLPLFFGYMRAFAPAQPPPPPPAPAPQEPWSEDPPKPAPVEDTAPSAPPAFLQTAFVDPSDPTKIFLTRPTTSSSEQQPGPNPYVLL